MLSRRDLFKSMLGAATLFLARKGARLAQATIMTLAFPDGTSFVAEVTDIELPSFQDVDRGVIRFRVKGTTKMFKEDVG
jgi:hypothetical protein